MASEHRILVGCAFREYQVARAYTEGRSGPVTDRRGRPPMWFKLDELGYGPDQGPTLAQTLEHGLARNAANIAAADAEHAEMNRVIARGIEVARHPERSFRKARKVMLAAERAHKESKRLARRKVAA